MTRVTDFLGREIRAGDTLVYPVRRGSEMWLKRILVTQVLPESVTGHNSDGRRVVVKNLQNTISVPAQN